MFKLVDQALRVSEVRWYVWDSGLEEEVEVLGDACRGPLMLDTIGLTEVGVL